VETRVQSLEEEIERLPVKSTEDPLKVILRLMAAFKKDVEQLVKGRPDAGKMGLVQTFRSSKQRFSVAISRQAPEFKPYNRPPAKSPNFQTPSMGSNALSLPPTGTSDSLDIVEGEDFEDPSTFVYLDEVLDVAK
jgi:hypothetical protein